MVRDEECACEPCRAGDCALCENWVDELDEDNVFYDNADGDPETMLIAIAMDQFDFGDDEDAEKARPLHFNSTLRLC